MFDPRVGNPFSVLIYVAHVSTNSVAIRFCQVPQILRILGGDLVFLKFRLTVLEFALRLSVDNALEQSIQMLSVLCIHAMFLFALPPIKKKWAEVDIIDWGKVKFTSSLLEECAIGTEGRQPQARTS